MTSHKGYCVSMFSVYCFQLIIIHLNYRMAYATRIYSALIKSAFYEGHMILYRRPAYSPSKSWRMSALQSQGAICCRFEISCTDDPYLHTLDISLGRAILMNFICLLYIVENVNSHIHRICHSGIHP